MVSFTHFSSLLKSFLIIIIISIFYFISSNADILVDRKIKERKSKDDSKDSVDFSDIEKNSTDSLPNEMVGIMADTSIQILPVINNFEIAPIEISPNTPSDNGKYVINSVAITTNGENNSNQQPPTLLDTNVDGEISICVVCDKRFKSKACLNKHMRSVHTVKILSSTKRSSSINNNHTKPSSSSKRTQSNESQSSITHIGLPVNPITAKALASKLNERNNFLNGQASKMNGINGIKLAHATTTTSAKSNNIPIPPLVSIQTPANQKEHKIFDTEFKGNSNDIQSNANNTLNIRKRSSNGEIEHETTDDDEPNTVSYYRLNCR